MLNPGNRRCATSGRKRLPVRSPCNELSCPAPSLLSIKSLADGRYARLLSQPHQGGVCAIEQALHRSQCHCGRLSWRLHRRARLGLHSSPPRCSRRPAQARRPRPCRPALPELPEPQARRVRAAVPIQRKALMPRPFRWHMARRLRSRRLPPLHPQPSQEKYRCNGWASPRPASSRRAAKSS